MNKKIFISIVILVLSSITVYGQQITFQKNVNSRANELTQRLSKNSDSLLLECKNSYIEQVDIFSDDYSERIVIGSNTTKIDLKKLPIGNYVVQAKIDQKWIVMYLEKSNIEASIASNLVTSNPKVMDIDYSQLSGLIMTEQTENRIPIYYWVVSESNSNFGSSKSMKLEYKEDIAKLISKHKLELKSNVGNNNKLLIYAIYNKSKFMNMQMRNPSYYESVEHSNVFNTEPFYTSENSRGNDSKP